MLACSRSHLPPLVGAHAANHRAPASPATSTGHVGEAVQRPLSGQHTGTQTPGASVDNARPLQPLLAQVDELDEVQTAGAQMVTDAATGTGRLR